MAFRDRKEQAEKVIEITANMQGSLSFKDSVNLRINGRFDGSLEISGTLTIGETGTVEANIIGENIIIAGKVKGDVTAKKMLVLMPTASLSGNIITPKLNIVEGALFQGRCQMIDDALDVDSVAKYLELDNSAILELANSGKIPALRNGNSWRFERSKIDLWAASEKVK